MVFLNVLRSRYHGLMLIQLGRWRQFCQIFLHFMRCLKSTSKHISNNSSGEEIYDNATVIYQTALISSGYYMIFTYTKIPISFNKVSKRKTKPRNFCFNPPFNPTTWKQKSVRCFLNSWKHISLETINYARSFTRALLRLAIIAREIWNQLFRHTIDKYCV